MWVSTTLLLLWINLATVSSRYVSISKRGDPPRDVFVILSQIPFEGQTLENGVTVTPIHVAIQLGSSEVADDIRLDIVRPSKSSPYVNLAVMRITEASFSNLQHGAQSQGRASINTVYRVGQTTMSNQAFASWAHHAHSTFRFSIDKRFPITGAYHLLLEMLKANVVNVPGDWNLPKSVSKAIKASQLWEARKLAGAGVQQPFPFEAGKSEFNTLTFNPPRGTVVLTSVDSAYNMVKTRPINFFHSGLAFPLLGARRVPVTLADGRPASARLRLSVYSLPEWDARFPITASCYLNIQPVVPTKRSLGRRDACSQIDQSRLVKPAEVPRGVPTERVTVRVGGKLHILEAFGKAGDGLTVVGLAAGPAFVLLDLAQGNTVGAAINGGGLALEFGLLLATRSLAFVGAVGLVTAPILFVLPIFFEKSYPPGRSNNVQEILQFQFFGDRSSQGNENCVKDRKSKNLGDDCTMLFGPGKIASALQWSNFDAVAFLIEFNDGYHMSIRDMAEAFHVMAVSPNPDDTADKTATIQCDPVLAKIHQPPPLPDRNGDALPPSAGYECKNPRFRIKRERINLPIINQTAADILPRIINRNGGDCKLVVDPLDGQSLPLYDFVWTGIPSAISCNITTPSIAQIGQTNGSIPATQITPISSVPETQAVNPGAVDQCLGQFLSDSGPESGANETQFAAYFNAKGSNSSIDDPPGISNASLTDTNATNLDSDDFNFLDYVAASNPDFSAWFDYASNSSNIPCIDQTMLDSFGNDVAQLPPAFFVSSDSSILNNATRYQSPGNASTDESAGRAYVAPPPQTPFALTDTTNSVCFSYTDHNLCLPNGTYYGIFTNPRWELKKVQSMTGPPGSWVTFRSKGPPGPPGPGFNGGFVSNTYHPNITSGSSTYSNFQSACNRVASDSDNGKLDIVIPTERHISAVCLYTDPNFKGAVQCLGLGAGNIPADFQNQTSSLTTYKGASAYIYANRYGDASQTLVKSDIGDFSGLLFGTTTSMNDALVAAWVFDPAQQST